MSLQAIIPVWAIIFGFVLLLIALSWLEISRQGRFRNLRLTALVLALLSIAGLLLRPARERVKEVPPVLLLTEDFTANVVDSLREVHPQWEVYRTPAAASYPKSKELDAFEALTTIDHRIGAIAGAGLAPYALEYLGKRNYQFFPPADRTGLQAIAEKEYEKGQPGELQGIFRGVGEARQLLLKGPAGMADSVRLEAVGEQPFSLSFTPLAAGRWQYRLLEKDSSGHILSDHLLPLVVHPEQQLRILILQAFPTFEVRYLKDFLADRGHAVAVRSQLSRSNFRTEFANLPGRDLSRLNTSLLEDFDLLLADPAAFSQLSRNELYNLSQSVEKGLGFLGLINAESAGFRSWLGLADIGAELDTARLADYLQLPAYPVQRSSGREWFDMLRTSSDLPLAAFHYRDKGKIGYQTVQESYACLLRGDSLAYASVWMPVLEGTRREIYPDYTIELLHNFPIYTGQPLDFRITANQLLGEVLVDGAAVPMQEDPHLQDVWYGRSWLATPGWHRITVGEEALDFYAFGAEDWPGLKKANMFAYTRHAAQSETTVMADQQNIIAEPISRIWFYLLFLLSGGFLWLAPKL